MPLFSCCRQRLPWWGCGKEERTAVSIATGCWCWSGNALSFSWFSSVTPHTAWNWLFFHKHFQTQLRDYFHGPVCPAQRMICHLMQTLITGPTSGSCDYGSEGPASPASEGPLAVTRLRHSRPLQIRDNQPCQREGGSFLPQTQIRSTAFLEQTGWTGLQGRVYWVLGWEMSELVPNKCLVFCCFWKMEMSLKEKVI